VKKKILSLLFSLLVTSICFVAFIQNKHKTQNITDLKDLNETTDLIASELSNAFAYADILELMIQFNDGEIPEEMFNQLADMAVAENPSIANLHLAPDAVVTYIRPIDGNEAEIGHDLMNDESRRDAVLQAIDAGTVVMQGPIESGQGENLVFGRKAIMVDGEFWGLGVIAINYDDLMEECGLTSENLSFEYAIAVYDSGDEPSYILGDKKIIEHSQIYSDMNLSGQKWRIAIRHRDNLQTLLQECGWYLLWSLLLGAATFILLEHYIDKVNSAKTDPLTKSLNREEFQRRAKKQIKRRGAKCALLAIDLDIFKQINDTYGHLAGDEVLLATAQRMNDAIRSQDLVSRVGGDEFMILLCNVHSQEQVSHIMERIRELGEQDISIGDQSVRVGISIGHAMVPQDGEDYISLYQVADRRMYEQKMKRKETETSRKVMLT
jgi:diguanylate cyclase (GGDEF)-like protein